MLAHLLRMSGFGRRRLLSYKHSMLAERLHKGHRADDHRLSHRYSYSYSPCHRHRSSNSDSYDSEARRGRTEWSRTKGSCATKTVPSIFMYRYTCIHCGSDGILVIAGRMIFVGRDRELGTSQYLEEGRGLGSLSCCLLPGANAVQRAKADRHRRS